MRWHHRLYVALRGLFGSSSLDRELNEELQFHFDREVQANIESGMTPAQARRAASIAIGNPDPIRVASRDGRAGAWLRQFIRDLGVGVRLLSKAPAFSTCAIAISPDVTAALRPANAAPSSGECRMMSLPALMARTAASPGE